MNGWDKIRRNEDIVKTLAAMRVGTGMVRTMSTSNRVAEIVLGDYTIKTFNIVANAFVEVTS